MDLSKSSPDTIRTNPSHSFILDLHLHTHFPGVFSLFVFRSFPLAYGCSFGLAVTECSRIAEENFVPSVWGWVVETTKV